MSLAAYASETNKIMYDVRRLAKKTFYIMETSYNDKVNDNDNDEKDNYNDNTVKGLNPGVISKVG